MTSLIEATTVIPGDTVKPSNREKPVKVTGVDLLDWQKIRVAFSNGDVRTYDQGDQIILVSRPGYL